MATVNKDFKIKSGLIVEGTSATVNGFDVLTKSSAHQNYIIGLIGGSASSANTPDSVVLRDGAGSFAAQDITVDGTLTTTDIANSNTVTIRSTGNNIVLDADGWVYAGSVNPADIVATRGRVDNLIGDPTVDSSTGNTITDRITDAANTAESNANSATDSKLQDYTKTSDLDTTVDGYGYLKSSDLPTMYTNTDAINAISGALGNGIEYSGTFDVQFDNDTIVLDPSNRLQVDTTVIATNTHVGQLIGDNTIDGTTGNTVKARIDSAVANLVDSAPELLNTLNELAAAIADNPNYASDMATSLGNKQDTLTAGDGIYIDESNNITGRQQSGGGLKFVNAEAAIDRSTVDHWYDANGAAQTAETNAKSYADDLASNYDAAGTADTAITTALAANGSIFTAIANAVPDDTDGLSEGTNNLYFTAWRAKSEAANLLTNATKSNIQITADVNNNLTITAENGVADSTTDDLEEGNTNLYFTDSRALGAVDAATITPLAVKINNYRKEEATQQTVASASTVTVHSLPAGYESAKYLVRVVGTVGGAKHSQVSEILMTVDGSNNIAITEYGTIYTSENPLATFSAAYSGTYDLTATTAVNGCEVIAAATMLSWQD